MFDEVKIDHVPKELELGCARVFHATPEDKIEIIVDIGTVPGGMATYYDAYDDHNMMRCGQGLVAKWQKPRRAILDIVFSPSGKEINQINIEKNCAADTTAC